MDTQETIDWEDQWSLFAPGFQNGCAHIELEKNLTLRLAPGAGFGDLSHPTTRLMISLMKPHIKKPLVVDIGCGSGILSLAALLLGAKKTIGIDIEQDALEHAKKNAKLNSLDTHCFFIKPEELQPFPSVPLILMNMIHSEQKEAWRSFCKHLSLTPELIITSGILASQRETYLTWATSLGWSLIKEEEEGEWLAFIFQGN